MDKTKSVVKVLGKASKLLKELETKITRLREVQLFLPDWNEDLEGLLEDSTDQLVALEVAYTRLQDARKEVAQKEEYLDTLQSVIRNNHEIKWLIEKINKFLAQQIESDESINKTLANVSIPIASQTLVIKKSLRMESPYNPHQPVKTSDMFFGFHPEVKSIIKGLLQPVPTSFLVVAGRRMGKTSLLLEIQRRLKAENDTSPEIIPLYLSCQTIQSPTSSPAFFYNEISNKIKATSIIHLDNSFYRTVSEIQSLGGLEEVIINFTNTVPARFILLVDEFDVMFAAPHRNLGNELAGHLRTLLTVSPVSERIAIVVASLVGDDFDLTLQHTGSLLRNVVDRIQLHAFDQSETRALINKPTNNMLPDWLVDRIWLETGGHPVVTQAIMRAIWDEGLGEFTNDWWLKLKTALKHGGYPETYFISIFQNHLQAKIERDLYRGLCQHTTLNTSNGLSLEVLTKKTGVLESSPSYSLITARQALERLIAWGLVKRDAEDFYQVGGQLFQELFQRSFSDK